MTRLDMIRFRKEAELQADAISHWLSSSGYHGDTSALYGFLVDAPESLVKLTQKILPALASRHSESQADEALQLLADLLVELTHLKMHTEDMIELTLEINRVLAEPDQKE
jgi:hypothetical protein